MEHFTFGLAPTKWKSCTLLLIARPDVRAFTQVMRSLKMDPMIFPPGSS
jgi:hypothetical protein